MPIDGPIPGWILSIVAASTLFVVMFDLGLAIVPGEFRWVLRHPALLIKALFSVLMAISPGAPVALRRSLGAGGHRSFAPALQIAVAILAVVSMPLSIAALDEYYGTRAVIAPQHLARQVFFAQLLPLALGMVMTRLFITTASRLAPRLHRLGGVLLIMFLVVVLIDILPVVIGAGWHVAAAIAIVTVLALAIGHLLGGPEPATRTATAITSAARNPGLALLVLTLNASQPAIAATVLAYVVVSALTVIPYAIWRSRAAQRAAHG